MYTYIYKIQPSAHVWEEKLKTSSLPVQALKLTIFAGSLGKSQRIENCGKERWLSCYTDKSQIELISISRAIDNTVHHVSNYKLFVSEFTLAHF